MHSGERDVLDGSGTTKAHAGQEGDAFVIDWRRRRWIGCGRLSGIVAGMYGRWRMRRWLWVHLVVCGVHGSVVVHVHVRVVLPLLVVRLLLSHDVYGVWLCSSVPIQRRLCGWRRCCGRRWWLHC